MAYKKRIGGKVYFQQGGYASKVQAENEARKMRVEGKYARVFPSSKFMRSQGVKYDVYATAQYSGKSRR